MSKPLENMTASELTKTQVWAQEQRSKITTKFIEAGRGDERPSDYWELKDPLSLSAVEASNRLYKIQMEMERRRRWHGSLKKITTFPT